MTRFSKAWTEDRYGETGIPLARSIFRPLFMRISCAAYLPRLSEISRWSVEARPLYSCAVSISILSTTHQIMTSYCADLRWSLLMCDLLMHHPLWPVTLPCSILGDVAVRFVSRWCNEQLRD